MSSHTGNIVALAEDFFKAMNSHDPAKIAAFFAEDSTFWEASLPAPIKGKKAVEEHFRENWKAFPDSTVKLLNRITSGEWIADEVEWSGTHKGPIQAPGQPPIPPTGKHILGKAVAYVQTSKGKVKQMNIYYDNMAVMAQLGLMPGTGGTH